MTKLEIQDLLNTVIEGVCPGLQSEFFSKAFIEDEVMTASIHMGSSLSISVREVYTNGGFQAAKAETLVRKRTRQALLELQKLVQNSLDNLEKGT